MLKNLPVVQVRMNARSLAAIILYLSQCSYPFVYLFLILGKWQLERITPTSKWQHRKERVGEALVSLITRLKLALILSLIMKLKFIFINDWLFCVKFSSKLSPWCVRTRGASVLFIHVNHVTKWNTSTICKSLCQQWSALINDLCASFLWISVLLQFCCQPLTQHALWPFTSPAHRWV